MNSRRVTAEEIAAELRPKFPVFKREELLTDLEYGGTPMSRAVIDVERRVPGVGERLTGRGKSICGLRAQSDWTRRHGDTEVS